MALVHLLSRHPGVAEVVEACDGNEAWTKLAAGLRPALVCCDIVMPGMGGLELLVRTRSSALLDQTPFVMISSTSDRDAVQQAIAGGAQGFIVKPYTAALVARSVTKVLDSTPALSERPADTCRRLGIDGTGLERLTSKLADDADQLIAKLPDSTQAAAVAAMLQKLHSGAALLGLSRGSELLSRAMAQNTPAEDVEPILREVRRLISVRAESLAG